MLTADKTLEERDAASPDVGCAFDCPEPSQFYAKLQRQRLKLDWASLQKIAVSALAIILALVGCELITRVLVSITRPVQFGHRTFDAKYAIASQYIHRGKPCLFALGASHVNRGVYPELIENSLIKNGIDVAVRNFGCTMLHPSGALFLLEQALRHSDGPTVVIYDVVPPLVHLTKKDVEPLQKTFSPYFADSYMGQSMRSSWPVLQEVDLFLKQNVYLIKYRSLIKSMLLKLTRFASASEKTLISPGASIVNKECSTRGWSLYYDFLPKDEYWRNHRLHGSSRFSGEIYKTSGKSSFDPLNPQYHLLDDVRQFCQEKRIPLVLLWMPVHPKTKAAYEKRLGLDDSQMKEMMLRVAANSGSILIDAHDLNDEDYFFDGDHLNVVGAVTVSKRISNELLSDRFKDVAKHLQSQSWKVTHD